ncbi:4Fe-4S dicluster domain-containing protein [Roseomonas sp. M0104]|uniref:4Fe-4S dicluster domain-containing protein n=1 Tax=Teichococcus coralli TaxID=2545983 RepID=A0A845BFU8_9PROT|nr:4Fe-4S dicluster domain-containing protein [Pseudoroseomonas coralli]MXP64924.1 4Fe-4S dicluster domain-containing protein [Pseudoroseomonas coralli]
MTDSANQPARTVFACSCEDSMALDDKALARGCGGRLRSAEQLCRSQLDRFLAALGQGDITVGCTQEAPLFRQEAEAAGHAGALDFVNIREQAGWSDEGSKAGPKMAALLAAAAVPMPPVPLVSLESQGVALILGRDAAALELAEQLKEKLDLTVLLTGEEEVSPRLQAEYPVLRGRARNATGWLGHFAVTVDGFAAAAPSSRAAYRWGASRDGATSQCDLIIDLAGQPPLFPAHEVRQGYLRAAPDDAAAVARLAAQAGELVGSFDKPRFIRFEAGLCAHARNKRTGCTRCLDLCPTGAITPGAQGHRDSVAISAEICAGCGACAAVCPTGAAQYALPPTDALLRRVRTLLLAYRAAGGAAPTLLLHGEAGDAMLDALARQGPGLPAHVLPVRVNEPTAADLALLVAPFAWGASSVQVLLPAHRPHGAEGVLRNLGYAGALLAGLGMPHAPGAIETDDPFTLREALEAAPRSAPAESAEFLPMGAPREILKAALGALRDAAGSPADAIALPVGAPFGEARVAVEGCTLCLACTMVCPTGAFAANPDRPELSFLEEACVQCGLCASTCPEKVIALVPRLNLAPEAAARRVVKQEEPAICPSCAKAFGTRASIERVKARLRANGHWMFQDPARLALLDLCEDCRVGVATGGQLDPYAGPARPRPRTSEDYLRERE